MIGFEVFDIKAWLDQGLTRHLVVSRKLDAPVRKSGWKAVLLISVAACGMTTLEGDIGNMSLSESWGTTSAIHASSKVASQLSEDLPLGYWPKLISTIDTWKPLEEVALSEPDPIV